MIYIEELQPSDANGKFARLEVSSDHQYGQTYTDARRLTLGKNRGKIMQKENL